MLMGLLLDYLQMFATETKRANGIVSRKTISEWFGNKEWGGNIIDKAS